MSDLVKDLREYRVGCGLHCDSSDAGEPLAECLQAAARIEALEAALQGVARVAHQGGLASMSEADALTAIRRLTLPYWDKSAPDDEARAALPHP